VSDKGLAHVEFAAGDLWLRPPAPGEAADALAMLHDPQVAIWNPAPSVVDEASAAAWLARGADWTPGDHATLSVLGPDGRYAGVVSLHHVDRYQATADIGYRVAPWARGRGVATTAVRAVTDWAFAELSLVRIQIFHGVGNPGSCRVAEKAGYALEGVLRSATLYGDGRRHDDHVHARLAADPSPA
jgi:RimJ/RimL family protein N-acetyltransferase